LVIKTECYAGRLMLSRSMLLKYVSRIHIVLTSFGLCEHSSVVGICEHGSDVAFQEMSVFYGMESILCAFENLQNGTVSFILSVCLSDRPPA
jgi:hypothetical protein